MRSYIFTSRERKIIRKILEGELSIRSKIASSTISRIRAFRNLASDVELYLRIRHMLDESERAGST